MGWGHLVPLADREKPFGHVSQIIVIPRSSSTSPLLSLPELIFRVTPLATASNSNADGHTLTSLVTNRLKTEARKLVKINRFG